MARKLVVEIIGDASSLEKTFRQADKSTSRFGSTLGKVGKAAAFTAGGAALGGLFVGLKRGVDEFNETQKVAAQTAAVLKSTGRAAGVNRKQIENLANSLSRMTGIDDEAIQSTENLLLTFTDVRNGLKKNDKIFDRATETVLDMSVALGQDTRTSAIQLGKALNDPIRGISSLRRVGVSFTDAQKEQIEALVESGKKMEAQKIILRELSREFGGSAKAAGDTFAGSLNKLKNSFDEVAGTIITAVAPALKRLADRVNVWLSKAENQERIQKAVTDTLRVLGQVIGTVTDVINALRGPLKTIVDLFGGWKNVLIAIIALKVATKLAGITSTLLGISGAIGGPKGVLSQMKALRASAALPILFSIGFSLAQIGSSSRSVGSVPGGPQDIQSQVGNLTAYYDPIDKKHRLIQTRKGETAQQAAMRDFKSRHPGKGPGTAASRGFGRQTVPGGGRAPSGVSRVVPPGAAGTRSVQAVNISGPVTVVANNPDEFIKGMQKWARRQSASRTGRFGGHNLGMT